MFDDELDLRDYGGEPIVTIEVSVTNYAGDELLNEYYNSVESLEEDLYKLYEIEEQETEKVRDYARMNG